MNINRATGATAVNTLAALSTGKLFETLTTNKAIANAVVTASLIPQLQHMGYFNDGSLTEASEASQTVIELANQWNEKDGLEAALEIVRGLDTDTINVVSKATQRWATEVWNSSILPLDLACKASLLKMYK